MSNAHIYCLAEKEGCTAPQESATEEREKVTSILCHEIAADNTVSLFVSRVNELEPYGEVNTKGPALLDVQLVREDIPCPFCTIQRGKEGKVA